MKKPNLTRAEIIGYIAALQEERKALLAEAKLFRMNAEFYRHAGLAIDGLKAELALLDLVEFCNTGEYPFH